MIYEIHSQAGGSKDHCFSIGNDRTSNLLQIAHQDPISANSAQMDLK
jgi:hypothetical protein